MAKILQIRRERRQKAWTLAEVSKRTGISIPDLSRIELGQVRVYPGWSRRLVRLFQKPADSLFAPVEGEGEITHG
ncbi:MAG TPA: helix-turn-helix transcriptional regulator [Firmicutes bacterium]|nr:helix-turn-helix transcriptional regulator [Candidatus Fermentithermobacillaceae bacterium]